MQIKTRVRYHFTPIRTAMSEKQKITRVDENVEKLEFWCIVAGNVKWCSHYEKYFGGFSES